MAKYTYNYSCGHGTGTTQIVGAMDARERKLTWLSDNMVCPDCYKKSQLEQDAAAVPTITIHLVVTNCIRLVAQASGHIEANKDLLRSKGFAWGDSVTGGTLSLLSLSKPKRMLQIWSADIESESDALAFIGRIDDLARGFDLEDTYQVVRDESILDVALLRAHLAAKAKAAQAEADAMAAKAKAEADAKAAKAAALAAVQATDPRPATSPLRLRIAALEKESGAKWNGKLYGGKGRWNFYVNNIKHDATDAEVAEREQQNAALIAWKNRHPELA